MTMTTRARQYVMAVEQKFDYTDLTGVATSLVQPKLPQGAVYLRGGVLVETAFNGTTPTLNVGSLGGSATAYASALDLAATGYKPTTTGVGAKSTGDTVTLGPNAGAQAATQGAGRLIMEYLITDRALEVQP